MQKKMAELFKALSDENRLIILKCLIEGETCGCTLIDKLPISQPTLSYHLKFLSEAGLTSHYKEGTWKKHQVNYEVLESLITFLIELRNSKKVCDEQGEC